MSKVIPLDVLGQEIKVGSQVAAGMAYNRSSVLRIGIVRKIVSKPFEVNKFLRDDEGNYVWDADGAAIPDGTSDEYHFAITVEWTHTQNKKYTGRSGMSGKTSTIMMNTTYGYAKLLVLPEGFTEQALTDS